MFNSKKIKEIEERILTVENKIHDLKLICVKESELKDLVSTNFNKLIDELITNLEEDFGKVSKVKNKKRSTRLAK